MSKITPDLQSVSTPDLQSVSTPDLQSVYIPSRGCLFVWRGEAEGRRDGLGVFGAQTHIKVPSTISRF